jgi:hypothetical protein
MKKEWLVKTLALSVVVLFISVSFQPVFAIENKTPVINNQSEKNESYVDPNIHLTRTNLPILKRSFNYFRNSNCYDADIGKVMEQIIKLIEFKGSINSEDVENILIKNDVSSIDIHNFCRINGEGAGTAVVFPLTLLEILLSIMTGFSWTIFIGIGGLLNWESDYGSFRVGFKTYSYVQNCYAFGFFGDGYVYPPITGYGYSYLVFNHGFALIAFVRT